MLIPNPFKILNSVKTLLGRKSRKLSTSTMEYKIITKDRFDEVVQHLRESFFTDEPLNKAVGLCKRGGGNAELEKHSYKTLEDNISIMAVNENDEIAGVGLNGIMEREYLELAERNLELCCDENFKKIFSFLNMVNKKANIFEKFDVDKVFDVRMLSVDERYRGKGIAKELVTRSEQLAKNCDFRLVKTEGTGIFSQKIFKSNGFSVLEEYYYDKWLDEFGNPILKVEPPHIKLQLLYKCLH